MGQTQFQDRERYQPAQSYRLLPFQFMQFGTDARLLVNEVGEHAVIRETDFSAFVRHELRAGSDTYLDLKAKHFLFDSDARAPFELLAIKYRTRRAFLTGFTKLHIFVVTLRCEHSCPYCQVSRVSFDKARFDMTAATASRTLDLVFRSPAPDIKIEFQGGEPLLNFERVKHIIEEAEARNTGAIKKSIEFVVCSNLALLDHDILEYFRVHNVFVSTSLDGPDFIHNANRPRPGGNSHQLATDNLRRAREALGEDHVSALMTTTRASLAYPHEIIDEYLKNGFRSIFLRPLSPYGFAVKTARTTGYPIEDFVEFYKRALAYVLALNRAGTFFMELYARLILMRILSPFPTGYVDLQSPAGAGIGVAVYNYDGDVYATDESRMLAEMGDKQFKLGNVHSHSYEAIFGGELLRSIVASSCVEAMPGCADCAFQTYCGGDPVHNYATQGDLVGHRPTSDFHKKNFAIIKHLLELYHSDGATRDIFHSWLQNAHYSS
ncbi:MAG TPA: His-Xaa-Ser system radical SAM maturase HxsB [Terriglobia bacterium]|nr:His-Xaa-Ser system radical SAM maturase HxsB [Terriglobia bacterium]